MKAIIAFILAVILEGCAFSGGTMPYITGKFERGTEGVMYMAELRASGVPPIEWEIDGLPAGLDYSVNTSGEICTVSGISSEELSSSDDGHHIGGLVGYRAVLRQEL